MILFSSEEKIYVPVFPTDVLAGILFGVVMGIVTVHMCDRAVKKRSMESDQVDPKRFYISW